MNDSNFVIEAHDLTKGFNGKIAVNHIDLNVRKGELYAFLGPNGSGKSTTIKMLMDLLQPTYGSVSIFNRSLQDNPLEIKRRIAYIPDTPNTLGKLTGDEYLDFYASIFHMDKDRKKNVNKRISAGTGFILLIILACFIGAVVSLQFIIGSMHLNLLLHYMIVLIFVALFGLIIYLTIFRKCIEKYEQGLKITIVD